MWQTYDYIENTLRQRFLSTMDAHNIPYVLDKKCNPDFLVTFFVTNDDIPLPKKQATKYRITHPKIKITFSLAGSFDYEELLKSLYSKETYSSNKSADDNIILRDFSLLHSILRPDCAVEILSKIQIWAKDLLYNLLPMYKDSYCLTLARLPFEMYLESDTKMWITKLPSFMDLAFVTDTKIPQRVDLLDFLRTQENIAAQISNQFNKNRFSQNSSE